MKRTAIVISSLAVALGACGQPASSSGQQGEATRPARSEQKLAFAVVADSGSSNAGDVDIYVSGLDGRSLQPLLASDAMEFHPEWSPEGSRLAFVSDRDEPGNMDIYVATSDGSAVTRVTYDPAIDTAPSWSPDGTRLAFSRNIEARDEIFVAFADGTGETRLTDNTSVDLPVEWSPDGAQIAFARNDDGQVDVWLMNRDGTDQRRLTNDRATETNLSWAPDGSRIAVTRSVAEGRDLEIALLSLEDGMVTQVTDDDIDQRYLAWSPDGDELIFTGNIIGAAHEPRVPSALYVLDLRSGRQHRMVAMDRDVLMPTWRR